jgi:hypothetical protein
MGPTNRPLPGKQVPAVRMQRVRKKSQLRMTKRSWAVVLVAILIVGAGAVWAWGYFAAEPRDPRVAEIGAMWAKMKDLPEKDRFAKMGEIFKKFSALPPDLQRKLQEEGMKRGASSGMMGPDVRKLLALPIDKRNAEIDKQLDQMLAMQKMMALMPKNGAMFGGGGAGGQKNAWRNRMLSSIPASSKAGMTQWYQLMQVRAQQRGVTMPW